MRATLTRGMHSETVRVRLSIGHLRRNGFVLQAGPYFTPLSPCCGDYFSGPLGSQECDTYYCRRKYSLYEVPLPMRLDSEDFDAFLTDYLGDPLLGLVAADGLRDYLKPIHPVISYESALNRLVGHAEAFVVGE